MINATIFFSHCQCITVFDDFFIFLCMSTFGSLLLQSRHNFPSWSRDVTRFFAHVAYAIRQKFNSTWKPSRSARALFNAGDFLFCQRPRAPRRVVRYRNFNLHVHAGRDGRASPNAKRNETVIVLVTQRLTWRQFRHYAVDGMQPCVCVKSAP